MKIDIMIPYWGDPAYMKETLQSVLSQSSPAWHCTVIDDAYPGDEIERFIAELDDPRITYIRKEQNEGLVANFRSCVAAARQPWMVMLGADDRLLPTYVAEVLHCIESYPEASIIQPGVRVIDEHGHASVGLADQVKQRLLRPRGERYHLLHGETLAAGLLQGDWLYWPSLAFRTEAIQAAEFRDEYTIILDLDLILGLIMDGAHLLVSPRLCFEYRRHAASESSIALLDGRRFAGERAFFTEAAERASQLGWPRAARAARLHLTSRLHAALLIPTAALRARAAVGPLIQHALR